MVETIVAMEWKTDEAWVESGRVGSGRVGWTPLCTQLDPSITLFSLRRNYITVHFVFQAERLKQVILSLDKLSIKAVMHTKIDYC